MRRRIAGTCDRPTSGVTDIGRCITTLLDPAANTAPSRRVVRQMHGQTAAEVEEILRWSKDGRPCCGLEEIPSIMDCHLGTLRTYRERIAKRHGITGKSALIAWAIANGLA